MTRIDQVSNGVRGNDAEKACHPSLDDIWALNYTVPEPVEACVHALIKRSVCERPSAPAVCSWDGDLTYKQLDQYSSRLAHRLVDVGVGSGTTVILCFEKSLLVPVAALGVMKAGGTSIALDITHPQDRLGVITAQASAAVVLSSASNYQLARQLGAGEVVIVDLELLSGPMAASQPHPELPEVRPSDILCVIFTPDWTGKPKGASITHRNFSSAITYQQKALGLTSNSRVFDFAPFAFHVSWYNLLHTLTCGGCLCIPSEAGRRNNIEGSMAALRANYALMTPTIARTLDYSKLPGSFQLNYVGEPVTPRDVNGLRGDMTVLNTYGSAETTSLAAMWTGNDPKTPQVLIGPEFGICSWVVEADNPDSLAPFGEVGELWLEGPLVCQGYLNEPEKTAAAFVEDPAWLLRGAPKRPGRHGRVYRTGDLVRYGEGGELVFVGRKEQSKIQGRYVELNEVENHLRQAVELAGEGMDNLQLIAETIQPQGAQDAVLVAFVATDNASGDMTDEEYGKAVQQATAGLTDQLAKVLPAYMVPAAYIPIQAVPVTATGKIDRQCLRSIGSLLTTQEVSRLRGGYRRSPKTRTERSMQSLWAEVLRVSPERISIDDDFFSIGGNAIGALKLSRIARDQGLFFAARDVYQHPILHDLSASAKSHHSMTAADVTHFSLLGTRADGAEARTYVARLCRVQESQVIDILPCTPLQEGLLSLTARRDGDYLSRNIFEIRREINMDKIRGAWDQVVAMNPILRTRMVSLPRHGIVQAVLEEGVEWVFATDLDDYQRERGEHAVGLGTPLTTFAILDGGPRGRRYFLWEIHHALYDGWSLSLLLKEVEHAYYNQASQPLQPMTDFIKYIKNRDEAATKAFWQAQFAGIQGSHFPTLTKAATYHPAPDRQLSLIIPDLGWGRGDFTAATIVRAAWAVVAAQSAGSNEALFGVTVTGRQAEVDGIELMAGPAIATVPIRVTLDWDGSVRQLLDSVQRQATDMIPFEQTGLQRIRRVGEASAIACDFQTLLVVQPVDEDGEDSSDSLFVSEPSGIQDATQRQDFGAYAMVVESHLEADGVRLRIGFDSNVIGQQQVDRIGQNFEYILRQLSDAKRGLERLKVIAQYQAGLDEIWTWNAVVPESMEACIHDLIVQRANELPSAPAICAWDGDLTYKRIDELSTSLAHQLVSIGIEGTIVPLFFEKSMWMPVAAVAVMKAGGASVAMEISQPEERLRSIAAQANSTVALSSVTNGSLARRLGLKDVIIVGRDLGGPVSEDSQLPAVSPSNLLYIVFTSGSTGTPKGAMVTHRNFCSAITYQQKALGYTKCTPTITFAEVSGANIGIGRGAGVCTWVVEPDDPETLAPIGAVGELWVEGPLVGQGYLNDADKTAAAFIQDPAWLLRGASRHPGRRGRVYRTGDLVRYQEDGTLAFVGRKDTQVKIRGQRIELGEVEHHVRQAIQEAEGGAAAIAQVVAETIQPTGAVSAILVAFVTLDNAHGLTDESHATAVQRATDGLADRLVDMLPAYMVPTAYIPIREMPMTTTGKADRRQLRSVATSVWLQYRNASDKSQASEPKTEVEKVLQKVWMSVLNLSAEEVSVTKAFMRLGGDSITAMQVASQSRLHNLAFTVSDVLQASTIRQLAARCRGISRHAGSAELEQEEDEDTSETFDLSPVQQMFFDAYPDGLNHFNQGFVLELSEIIPTASLNAAVRAVVSRHSMLRARFTKDPDSGVWKQTTADDDANSFVFGEHFMASWADAAEVAEWRQRHLDIRQGPVFACDIFNIPGLGQTLVLSAHHLVIDLVSWRIVWSDIQEHVRFGELRSQKTTSFRTWCKRQAKTSRNASPLSVLPFPVPKPEFDFWALPLSDNSFGDCVAHTWGLDQNVSRLLLGDSNEALRTEPMDILLGSLFYSFNRTFPERPVPAIWIEGHGREQSEDLPLDVSGTVGWFTTLYPLAVAITSSSSLIDAIRLAKDTRRRVPGKGQPYFACRYHSESGREAFQGHDVAEVLFNFTGTFQQLESEEGLFRRTEQRGEGAREIVEISESARRLTLIEVNVDVEDGELAVTFQVHKSMKHQDRLAQWAESFAQVAESATQELMRASAGFTLSDLPLLNLSYKGLDMLLRDQLPSMGIKSDAVADIYPCSPLQEGILLSSLKGTASYATYSVWQCVPVDGTSANSVSPSKLEAAWKEVVSRHTILSTVFNLHPDGDGFIQIVLPGSRVRITHIMAGLETPTAALHGLERPTFEANEPEHAFAICQSATGEVACRLDISHTLIDAISIAVLVNEITAAYDGRDLPAAPAFSEAVRYINSVPSTQRIASWAALLEGVEPCEIPVSHPPQGQVSEESYGTVTLSADLLSGVASFCRSLGITRSVFLQVAWAMVLSQFTGQHEACFGYLTSGRDAPVDGIENMVGPLANLLISRIDLRVPTRQALQTASKKSIEHLALQHASLRKSNTNWVSPAGGCSTRLCQSETRKSQRISKKRVSHLNPKTARIRTRTNVQQYDLSLSAGIDGDSMDIALEFREPYISRQVAEEACVVLTKAIQYLLAPEPGLGELDNTTGPESLFGGFFKHIVGKDEASTKSFWQGQFTKIHGSHFPPLQTATYRPLPESEVRLNINGLEWARAGFSATTIIRAAWSLVTARSLGSNEALFGATVSERPGALSVVPIRVLLDWEDSVDHLLGKVQCQAADMAPFHRTGLQRIRRVSDEASLGCDFQTLLVVLKASEARSSRPLTNGNKGGEHEETRHRQSFGAHAVVIEFQLETDGAHVCINFDSNVIDEPRIVRIGHQIEHVIRQLLKVAWREERLREVTVASQRDLGDIWTWNATVPESIEVCVHDLITRRAYERPLAPAINAWDGDLTYTELDELSTTLARELAHRGVGPGTIVPLCFEKSMWMPVAALAVMKTGGAAVAVDTTQPEERLWTILTQVNSGKPLLVLSSAANEVLVRRLGANEVVVAGRDQFLGFNSEACPELPAVSPSDVLYVVFTSGSTGRPKGALITHQNFSSAIAHQRDALGFTSGSRVFDFASYAFNIAWSNLLNTLTAGGCLCIPSAAEREDSLSACLDKYKITVSDFTPSVARFIEPTAALSRLSTMLLGGEVVLPSDGHLAGENTQVKSAYGPAECTPTSTILDLTRAGDNIGIGRGAGLCTWVVDMDNPEALAPIGAVGELWLEGPLVGQGYLHDPIKTAEAFIQDPVWLLRGVPGRRPGRRGRVYRTGDIVQYREDGTLLFIGRKDTQVKVRGQRVELGEVEHYVRQAIEAAAGVGSAQVIAETIQPKGAESTMLVAFVALDGTGAMTDEEYERHVRQAALGVAERLAESLPVFAVPTVYIPIRAVPMMATGKVDRRQLRAVGASLTAKDIAALSRLGGDRQSPRSETERLMQNLWAEVLNIEPESISIDDSFFRIGGDSIGAMRLVGASKQRGLSFAVRDIFKNPILRDLAALNISGSLVLAN